MLPVLLGCFFPAACKLGQHLLQRRHDVLVNGVCVCVPFGVVALLPTLYSPTRRSKAACISTGMDQHLPRPFRRVVDVLHRCPPLRHFSPTVFAFQEGWSNVAPALRLASLLPFVDEAKNIRGAPLLCSFDPFFECGLAAFQERAS